MPVSLKQRVKELEQQNAELKAELDKERKYANDNCMIGVFHGSSMANDKLRQLEREADWLASCLFPGCISQAHKYACQNIHHDRDLCRRCWREAARKGVADDD